MVASLGMSYYGNREAAKIRDNKERLSRFVQEMLFINLLSTFFAYLLLAIALVSIDKFQEYTALLMVYSISVGLNGLGMEWLYSAMEEYRYISLRTVAFQIVAVILMVILVKKPEDAIIYAAINVLASSGSYVLNFVNCRKYITWKWYGNYEIKKHLKPIFILFAMTVSINLYTALDSTMLGFLQGDNAVGLYTAGIKVNKVITSLITSLGVVLLPRLSYYLEIGEKGRFRELVDKAYHFTFILSVPICLGLYTLSDDIIHIFSGEEFADASLTMKILTPLILVIPFSVLTNNQIFVPMRKDKLVLLSACIGAVVNFCANMILIPLYAENGAAMGTVIAETAVMAVCFYNANKYLEIKSMLRGYWKYWIAVIPIPVIGYIIKTLGMHQIVSIGVIILLSGVSYFIFLIILKEEYVLLGLEELKKRFVLRRKN